MFYKTIRSSIRVLMCATLFLANNAISAVTIYPGTEASTTAPSSSSCVFQLSDHGDFHYPPNGPTSIPIGDSMVVDADDGDPAGTVLTIGNTVGPSSTWDSQAGYAWTTDAPGTMTAPQTAIFGLRCEVTSGSYKYGWVKFTEGTTTQSIDCFALEGTADTAITIDDSQCPSGSTSSAQNVNIYFDFNTASGSAAAPSAPSEPAIPVPTLPLFGLLTLGGLLGLFGLRKLKQ